MSIKVFVSYSEDTQQNKEWVVRLVNKLRAVYGINAKADAIDTVNDLNKMMIEGIRDSDKIIIVLTKEYTRKAEAYEAGVGKETRLLSNAVFNNNNKIVIVKKENCNVPYYLQGFKYVNCSGGLTDDKLEELVRHLQGMPEYESVPINKNPKRVTSKQICDDEDLIPDLRIISPKEEEKFLEEEFVQANTKVEELLKLTKQKYPDFHFINRVKDDIKYTNTLNMNFERMYKILKVARYEVNYLNKSAYFMTWLDKENKNIYLMEGRSFFWNDDYNSYNFSISINRQGKRLALQSYGMNNITNGVELGIYIYNKLMEGIK